MRVGTNVECGCILPRERGTQSPTRPNNYDPHLVPATPRCPFSISTGALQQFLPPPLVWKIPIDRFRDSIPSIAAGVPVQLAVGEAGINCIRRNVPDSTGDRGDQAVGVAQG